MPFSAHSVTNSDFSQRASPSELPELMDGDCTCSDFKECLRSLEQVNHWLLGYRPTLAWLSHLQRAQHHPIHIVDVGSGGGGLLRQIASWAHKRGIAVRLTGIDLNPHAAQAAAELTPTGTPITWLTGDALVHAFEQQPDILTSSLMAHHLEDEEIVVHLRWMEATARQGWFINDLERSQLSARAFGWLARAARWHPFVQHDGPVSFRRAFRRQDWERLLATAGIPRNAVTLERWRPGRLCVGSWKQGGQSAPRCRD